MISINFKVASAEVKRPWQPMFMALLLTVLVAACSTAPSSGPRTTKPKPVPVPDAAQSAYQDVLLAINNQDWPQAEAQLLQLKQSYPQLASLQATLGWVYWQSGQVEKAESELKAATKRRNLYLPDAYNYLAVLYREQGKFTEAEALYRDALQVWPDDPILHKNLGILYELYLGRLNDGLNHYRQAQAIRGGDKQLKGWIKDLERRTKQ